MFKTTQNLIDLWFYEEEYLTKSKPKGSTEYRGSRLNTVVINPHSIYDYLTLVKRAKSSDQILQKTKAGEEFLCGNTRIHSIGGNDR